MHSGEKRKRSISTVLLATLGFGAAIGASGCTPHETPPPPTTSTAAASASPVLPSNEEALAIVEELYPQLLKAQGSFIGNQLTLEELERVATADMVATIQESHAKGAAEGHVVTGFPTADTMSIQQVQEAAGIVQIKFYACFDRTTYIPLDSGGAPVLSSDAKIRIPVEAVVDSSEGSYKVDGYTPWPGNDFC